MATRIYKTKSSISRRLSTLKIRLSASENPSFLVELDDHVFQRDKILDMIAEINATLSVNRPINGIRPVLDTENAKKYLDEVWEERDYLVRFYNNACGSSWNKKWNLKASITTWAGLSFTPGLVRIGDIVVTCNRVKAINLKNCYMHANLANPGTDKDYAGCLPSDIDKLPCLETINLSYNFLNGPLPSGLCKLKKIKTINLEFNQITGNMEALKGLTSLEILSLDHNRLEGEIAVISTLTSLTTCNLHHNKLHGPIPATLAANTKLERFWFYRNYLEWGKEVNARIAKGNWKGREASERPAHLVFDK